MSILELPKVRGIYRFDYDLAPLTWFKVGGKCDVFFKPKDTKDLTDFLSQIDKSVPIFVIGACSNLLIRDSGIRGVVIKLGSEFAYIKNDDEDDLVVGASCLNHSTANFCLNNSISSFEFLIGIPGTAGGGISMNAGAYSSEFKDLIKSLKAVDRNGKIFEFTNSEIGFFYRGNNLPKDLIFTEAKFHKKYGNRDEIRAKMDHISSTRQKTQPIKEKTTGSTFRNPEGLKAWELIESVGMKGFSIGGAKISEMHSNFIINTSNANATDIEELIYKVKNKVLQLKNIDLELELKIIGGNQNIGS